MDGPLVDVAWLRSRLGEPGLVAVDCRWRLGDPGGGRREYERGHVPRAAFMDVDTALSTPPSGGARHPLPSPEAFEAAAARAGIGARSRVVAYDESGEGGAARLWWLLRHLGHPAVAVLDGGLRAWRAGGGPLEASTPGPHGTAAAPPAPAEPFSARPRPGDVAGAEEIAARLDDPRLALVDARAAERHRGEVEPIDPVAGHIPGSANAPFSELAPDGRYRPPDELRERLRAAQGGDLVAYCGSGVTACTVLLAAEVAGLGAGRLYAGSWSEWSSRGLPVETGS